MICRRCKREKREDEDWKGLKTCPICHEKDRADHRIKSSERELDRQAKTLIKKLDFEGKIPEILQNFSNYQKFWRNYGKEVTYEQYEKALEDHRKQEIQKKADKIIAKNKREAAEKRLWYYSFLRFDLYSKMSDECMRFRLEHLGFLPKTEMLREHEILCTGECKLWLSVLKEGQLCNEKGEYPDTEYQETERNRVVNLIPCDPDDPKTCEKLRLQYANIVPRDPDFAFDWQNHITCPYCERWMVEYKKDIGEIRKTRSFEEWEEQQGLKDICPQCSTELINGKCPKCQPD